MKKKMILLVTACAVLGLASCNHPAAASSSSAAPESSAVPSSSVDSTIYASSLAVDAESLTLKVEETHQINATVLPANVTTSGVTYSSDHTDIATVSEAGLITAVKAGTASITVTTKSLQAKGGAALTKTIAVTVNMKTISDITKAGTYDVKGVVAALTTKGFLLHDGTAGVYVYTGAAPTYTVGDYLEVKETLADSSSKPYQPYNGFYQFTSGAAITVLSTGAPTLPAATALTTDVANGWATASSFTPAAIQKYKWTTYAAADGTYTTINLDGSTTKIENTYTPDVLKPVAGNKYEVEGYLYGYSSSSSYAAIALTKLTQVYDAVTSIKVAAAGDATWTRVGENLQLTATIAPATGDPELIWTSSDDSKATIDQTGKITGVAEATGIVFTATSKSNSAMSGSITLDIHAENKTPITSLALAEGATYDLPVGCAHTLAPTILPAEANQNVTWVSSDETVATVDANGKVTPVKAGSAKITATTVGKDATDTPVTVSLALTVGDSPVTVDIGISDALAKAQAQVNGTYYSERYYKLTGLLEKVSFVDGSVGSCYLTDLTAQKSVKLVDVTNETQGKANFAYNSTTGVLSFPTLKTPATDLAGYANGQKAVFIGQIYKGYDGVPALRGYFISEEASTQTYSASVVCEGNGTATLSKTSEIGYGTYITVTTAPESADYEIKTVYVLDGAGFKTKATVDVTNPNSWLFPAGMVNEVHCVFGAVNETSMTLTSYDLGLTGNYTNGISSTKVRGTWVGLAFNQCLDAGYGIQVNNKPSYFYNTVAMPGYISKVTIVYGAMTTATSQPLVLSFSNSDQISTAATDTANAFGKEKTVIDVDTSYKYTFFQLCHLLKVSGVIYIESITIDFVVA